MTRISVVTPSFRQAQFLERTIASVLAQDHPDLEYIVVDGGSDVGSIEILERWSDRIDVVIVEPDRGQADALVKGFAHASGDVLAWINADDCYSRCSAVSTLLRRLAEAPHVDAVYGRRFSVDPEGRFLQTFPFRPFDEHVLRRACYLPQECSAFRRSAYEAVGGIDASFSFALDYDLWSRMLDAGAQFAAIPTIVGLFRWYPEQKSQALWTQVGLPEIARIQERSLDAGLGEDEMQRCLNAYRFGEDSRAGDVVTGARVNDMTNAFLGQIFRGRPLDRWPDQPSLLET